MGAILFFLALQDVLEHGVSTDPSICNDVTLVHESYGVREIAPCRYFTSRSALENHIAHEPINAETDACRLFILFMRGAVRTTPNIQNYVKGCVQETFPTTYNDSKRLVSCAYLKGISNITLSAWSAAMVAWDRYTLLGGGDSALATVCYASKFADDILDDIVKAGKALNESFAGSMKMLQMMNLLIGKNAPGF
jgi:hypothetical protein